MLVNAFEIYNYSAVHTFLNIQQGGAESFLHKIGQVLPKNALQDSE